MPAHLLSISKTAIGGCARRGVWLLRAHLFARAVAVATIAGFLLGLILAASPELHERWHHDSDAEHHECLATVLHVGGCEDPAPVDPLANFIAILLEESHQPDWSLQVDSLYLRFRILEHAPPRGA